MDHMGFWVTFGVIIEENRDKIIQSSGKKGMKSGEASLRSQKEKKVRKSDLLEKFYTTLIKNLS